MQIVEPYAHMLSVPDREAGIALLRKIEWCARVSHASEDAQTEDSWDRFLRSVILTHGDWSVTEHASVTVDAVIDRGISHEWVRHRLGAYTQSSTRFINYDKKIPPSFVLPVGLAPDARWYWENGIEAAIGAYKNLLAVGSQPQIARSVFPNSLATRLIVTYNLRMWRHFLLMRTTKEAHPQMRQVVIPLLAEFQVKIPVLFEDIEPMARQSDNLKKMR